MKEVTSELNNFLRHSDTFFSCDLYDLHLVNGESVYFCEYDEDIQYNGHRYLHDMCIAERTSTELRNNLTVDKLSLSVRATEFDTVENTPLVEMARNGGLDGATLVCSRMFLNENDEVIGVVKLFTGRLEVRSGGGMTLKLDIKSKIQLLNVEWPSRRYYPTCAFSLYSGACGVNPRDYRVNARIVGVHSRQEFTVDVEKETGYFDNGAVQFMTGPLVGKDATIKGNVGSRITLLVSEEEAPKVGDMVKLYPGCDRTHDTCIKKFGKSGKYKNRSTPYVPLKESVV